MKPGKDIALFIAGILLIALFFLLPRNRLWLTEKVFAYFYDFHWQKNNMNIEARKINRYGNAYIYSKGIAIYLNQKNASKQDVVLIPPAAYFKNKRIEYDVPEPAVFYYYTGVKSIWAKSPYAMTANWYVHAVNGKLQVDRVSNKQAFADSVTTFKKYPATL